MGGFLSEGFYLVQGDPGCQELTRYNNFPRAQFQQAKQLIPA
jgi:hypothetical protein